MRALLNWLFPDLYWTGRYDGWKACENMILERAKSFPQYSNIWEDLIQ